MHCITLLAKGNRQLQTDANWSSEIKGTNRAGTEGGRKLLRSARSGARCMCCVPVCRGPPLPFPSLMSSSRIDLARARMAGHRIVHRWTLPPRRHLPRFLTKVMGRVRAGPRPGAACMIRGTCVRRRASQPKPSGD